MKTISCKVAKACGLARYFTGKPCKNGHVAERYVAQSACVICTREKARDQYQQLDEDDRAAYYASRKEYVRHWKAVHADSARELNARSNAAAKARNPNYFKQHYRKNSERRKQQAHAWYRANRERAAEIIKKYRTARPDWARALGRKNAVTRRARKLELFIEVVDPAVVFKRAKGRCGICLMPVDPKSRWEVDHVIPLSKGGVHGYDNVQLAHRSCNRRKSVAVPKGQPTLFQVKA